MSLFPVRFARDSVNGGTYDFRCKAAKLWRDSLENTAAIDGSNGSRYWNDFMTIADAPAVGTLTGEIAVRDLDGNATSEACIKAVPASTTTRPLHGWVRASATTAADLRGIQVSFPNIGDMRFTTGKRTVCEHSVNIRKTSSFFIGAGETGAAIMSDSETMADKDFIGFRRVDASSTAGPLKFVVHRTGVTEQAVTIMTAAQFDALSASSTSVSTASGAEIDVPVNFGWAYNGNNTIDISVNGVMYPVAAATLNAAHASTACFPTLSLTRVQCLGRATNATTGDEATVAIETDWIESFQG